MKRGKALKRRTTMTVYRVEYNGKKLAEFAELREAMAYIATDVAESDIGFGLRLFSIKTTEIIYSIK
jgi:hypothetical protein